MSVEKFYFTGNYLFVEKPIQANNKPPNVCNTNPLYPLESTGNPLFKLFFFKLKKKAT